MGGARSVDKLQVALYVVAMLSLAALLVLDVWLGIG